MPGVTISAGYGAGGSLVAPMVAERLGLRLIDRAISSTVAMQLQVSVAEAHQGESHRSVAERFFGVLTPLTGMTAPPLEPGLTEDAATFREHTERLMREALADGAVILGRAGAAAFATEPDVLRVRLFGPPEARIAQAAAVEAVPLDRPAAAAGGRFGPGAVRPPALPRRPGGSAALPPAAGQHRAAAGHLRRADRAGLSGNALGRDRLADDSGGA